jgi:hypothetical protein
MISTAESSASELTYHKLSSELSCIISLSLCPCRIKGWPLVYQNSRTCDLQPQCARMYLTPYQPTTPC